MVRVRLDYERRGWREEYYTLLPLDTDGRLATLDRKMERLRKQHVEATLYALDASDQVDIEQGHAGIVGEVCEDDPQWNRWRENGLV